MVDTREETEEEEGSRGQVGDGRREEVAARGRREGPPCLSPCAKRPFLLELSAGEFFPHCTFSVVCISSSVWKLSSTLS
jgi:hypothetical protein